MARRKYYTERVGHHRISTKILIELFAETIKTFVDKRYFDLAFGNGVFRATMEPDVNTFIYRQTGVKNAYPIDPTRRYKKEQIFSLMELFFDHVSLPNYFENSLYPHKAQEKFRLAINEYLPRFEESGWELTSEGEVCQLPNAGMEDLLQEGINSTDMTNITARVDTAVTLFRRRDSKSDDKRNAVRQLGDVLEFLKKSGDLRFEKQDESDLFHILNAFSIRHHKPDQKSNYDQDIYLDWLFYHYLAAVHAATRIIERNIMK